MPAKESIYEKYVKAIILEILSYRGVLEEYQVKTIFIGGGTPSILREDLIEQIVTTLKEVFHIKMEKEDSQFEVEVTIETNPGTLTKEKLQVYQKLGINRISIGLQSASNQELEQLGRIHTWEQFQEGYQLAREVGFKNINVDLMSAIPNQTVETWTQTLEKVVALNPEHISAYSLIIEEGTPFFEQYDTLQLPAEETERNMYYETKRILEKNGYHQYEISNYAKKGYECKHNKGYWTSIQYLGIGLGSSSLLKNARFHNESSLEEYCLLAKDYIQLRRDMEHLTSNQMMEEFMFLGLRLTEGIEKDTFFNRFQKPIETIYGGTLKQLEKEGLLNITSKTIALTEKGIDVSNYALSFFLLNEFVRS